MKNRLALLLLLSPLPLLFGCTDSRADLKIKQLKDSLGIAQKAVDSLGGSNATRFAGALKLEKRHPDSAMAIYQRLLNPKSTDYFEKQAFIRFHYLEAMRFLAYITRPDPGSTGPETYFRQFKVQNIDTCLAFFHSAGLTIKAGDAYLNRDPSGKFMLPELRKQLVERKGPAFDMIAQLSYIYSQPWPQYNTISMNVDGIETIRISFSEFELTFTFDGSYERPIKLTQIECFHIADV